MTASLTFSRQWWINAGNLSRYTSSSALIQNQRSVLAIKNVLIGGVGQFGWTDQAGAAVAAPSFWTVYYSATNTVAGVAGDGVDRWSVFSDIVWNSVAGAGSWMVLHNATAGLYWLINCENAASDSTTLDMWVSTDAFVGGTTTTRPTAPSEFNMLASTFWGSNGTPIRFHVMVSADGLVTRVFTNYQTTAQGAWFIDTMLDAVTNVQGSTFAAAYANASGNAASANLFTQTPRIVARKTGGPSIYGVLTGEGSRYASNIQAALPAVDRVMWNDIAGMNQLAAVGVSGTLASGSAVTRGHIGSMVDIWWGSDAIPSGQTFPDDYSRQLMSWGPFVIPWNGTVPKVF